MNTNADIAARLLREAANFFRKISEEQPSIKDQMAVNANMYDRVAELIETDPTGTIEKPEE